MGERETAKIAGETPGQLNELIALDLTIIVLVAKLKARQLQRSSA